MRILTNKRYLNLFQPNSMKIDVPDHLSDSLQRRKLLEWRYRTYYEAKDTIDNGNGFCLFDTLTVDDHNMKYFHDFDHKALYNAWDFMAFSKPDIQKFFKRLRINIERGVSFNTNIFDQFGYKGKHFDVNLKPFGKLPTNSIRYIVTCEYGSKRTCRVHYHVLFFVNFKIDPFVFSNYVAYSWLNGRTDGSYYKGRRYVFSDRLFRDYKDMRLVNYVTKYITKDFYIYKRLFRRVFMSFSLSHPNWQASYSKRLEFRRFKNAVLPFHVQSRYFGLSALKHMDIDSVVASGCVSMPSNSRSVVKSMPLPRYYRYRLFYHKVDEFGRISYVPNNDPLSCRFFENEFNRSYNRFLSELQQFGLNSALACKVADYYFRYKDKLVPWYLVRLSLLDLDERSRVQFPRFSSGVTPYSNIVVNNSHPRDRHFGKACFVIDGHRFSYNELLTSCILSDHSIAVVVNSEYDTILDNFFDFKNRLVSVANNDRYVVDRLRYRYKQYGLLKC